MTTTTDRPSVEDLYSATCPNSGAVVCLCPCQDCLMKMNRELRIARDTLLATCTTWEQLYASATARADAATQEVQRLRELLAEADAAKAADQDGTSGQDRESYSDNQDRESYS